MNVKKKAFVPPELDKIIHEPTRLGLMAALMTEDERDFVSLKKSFGLSSGKLNAHLRVLEDNGYIIVKKGFVNRKPRTTYSLNRKGKESFRRYIDHLEQIVLNFSSGN